MVLRSFCIRRIFPVDKSSYQFPFYNLVPILQEIQVRCFYLLLRASMSLDNLREVRRESHPNLLLSFGLRVRLGVTTNVSVILRGSPSEPWPGAYGGGLTVGGGPGLLGGGGRIWSARPGTFLSNPLRTP